ncbi:MAG: hypothetical protein WA061_02160 [Microgenomates group bacterium]
MKSIMLEEEVDNLEIDDDEYWEQFEEDIDGYDEETGECRWVEMSYYSIPSKTNWVEEFISKQRSEK